MCNVALVSLQIQIVKFFTVTDDKVTVGFIEKIGIATYVANDPDGNKVATANSVIEAARALGNGRVP